VTRVRRVSAAVVAAVTRNARNCAPPCDAFRRIDRIRRELECVQQFRTETSDLRLALNRLFDFGAIVSLFLGQVAPDDQGMRVAWDCTIRRLSAAAGG
jgi:hypothetical protein